jgi:hypothetical protein
VTETDGDMRDPELDAVQAELAAALRDDPVPPGVVEAARVAWTWRVVDAELAELLAEDTALVRSVTDATVAYAVGDVVVDVERVIGAGGVGVVVGLVTGATPVDVAVEIVDRAGVASHLPAVLDAAGGFRTEVPTDRPARVVVTLPGDRRVVTPWLPS